MMEEGATFPSRATAQPTDGGSAEQLGASPTSEIIESIMSRFNGFLYRCAADAEFTMLYASDGIERVLGHPASDFVGNAVRSFFSVILEKDQSNTMREFTNAVDARRAWNLDYRLVSSSGTPVWVNDIGAAVFDASGILTALEGVVTVIDARKEAEAQREALVNAAAAASERIISSTSAIFGLLSALRTLALNARIEAARAGSVGAGFSTVAREIDGLARQTSVMAKQIDTATEKLRGTSFAVTDKRIDPATLQPSPPSSGT